MERREMRKNSRKGTSLSVEQALEIFKNTEKIKEVALKEMRAIPLDDQDDMALELAIQEYKLHDELYLQYKIEHDDFKEAVEEYDLYNHPDAQEFLAEMIGRMPED